MMLISRVTDFALASPPSTTAGRLPGSGLSPASTSREVREEGGWEPGRACTREVREEREGVVTWTRERRPPGERREVREANTSREWSTWTGRGTVGEGNMRKRKREKLKNNLRATTSNWLELTS